MAITDPLLDVPDHQNRLVSHPLCLGVGSSHLYLQLCQTLKTTIGDGAKVLAVTVAWSERADDLYEVGNFLASGDGEACAQMIPEFGLTGTTCVALSEGWLRLVAVRPKAAACGAAKSGE